MKHPDRLYVPSNIQPVIGVNTVMELTGFAYSTLHRKMQLRQFPRPITHIKRKAAWRIDQVDAWLDKNQPIPGFTSETTPNWSGKFTFID